MYCRYCGKTIGDDSHYCWNCGKRAKMEDMYRQLYLPFGPDELVDPSISKATKEDLCDAVEDEDGVIYSEDGKRLLKCEAKNLGNYSIREGTKVICSGAFPNSCGLMKAFIPDSVTFVDKEAFSDCLSLIKIEVAEDNKYYCAVDGVLYSKDKSSLIKVPCDYPITNFSVPYNVNFIRECAFYHCVNLEDVSLPNCVTLIGRGAFHGCYKLKKVYLPDSLTFIGGYAFYSCKSLEKIIIPKGVSSILGNTFECCYNLWSIHLSKNITYIGYGAFYNCWRLREVTIPEKVIEIGAMAFYKAYSLEQITARSIIPPKCDASSFCYVDKRKCVLYTLVAYDAYSKAEGWKDFKRIY